MPVLSRSIRSSTETSTLTIWSASAEDAIGEPLLDADVGGPLDLVVETLEVLDVDRGDDVDPGVEQILDVLVALGVAAAGGVGVGQLVDQADGRPAGQDGVEVHLAEGDAAILDRRGAG